MGNTNSSTNKARIFLTGLDNAGKTTILYKLQLGEIETRIPIIGSHLEVLDSENMYFVAWDVGGCDKARPYANDYYKGITHIIFVLDSTNSARLNEAKRELCNLLTVKEFSGLSVLIFANKSDLDTECLSIDEIITKMELSSILENREWKVIPSSASTGDGLSEGLNWMLGGTQ